MKVTVEISDALLNEARRVAQQRGTTLRSLIETGLRRVLDMESAPREQFRLRKRPFGGQGLQPDLEDAEWSEIRRRAYEGRGG